jgi:hypothetical protein
MKTPPINFDSLHAENHPVWKFRGTSVEASWNFEAPNSVQNTLHFKHLHKFRGRWNLFSQKLCFFIPSINTNTYILSVGCITEHNIPFEAAQLSA